MNCPISTDRDSFSKSYDKPVSMVDILDATVSSSDPGALPSFTSGKLQMRTVAVHVSFLQTDENWGGGHYTVTVNCPGSRSSEQGTFKLEARWDENIPLGERSLHSQHWEWLQRQRSSKLLFVLVKFSFD